MRHNKYSIKTPIKTIKSIFNTPIRAAMPAIRSLQRPIQSRVLSKPLYNNRLVRTIATMSRISKTGVQRSSITQNVRKYQQYTIANK